MYDCQVIADSVGPNIKRITTFQLTFPRCLLSELRTHRVLSQEDEVEEIYRGVDGTGRNFSMNSASSRAIPVEKMLQMVIDEPYIPLFTGAHKGMQGEDRSNDEGWQDECTREWLIGRNNAVDRVKYLLSIGVHKQDANRLLEPFMWHTIVATSTDWANYLALRCHEMAYPPIRKIAEMMRDALVESDFDYLEEDDWHLPYVTVEDRKRIWKLFPESSIKEYHKKLIVTSVARCARVSYMRQCDEKTFEEDLALYNRLTTAEPLHASALEHVAQATNDSDLKSGNLTGWIQYRHTLENESTKEYTYKGVTIR